MPQLFIGVSAVTTLILAASEASRQRSEKLLQKQRSRLAEKVEFQTTKLSRSLARLKYHQSLLMEAEQIAHMGSWDL